MYNIGRYLEAKTLTEAVALLAEYPQLKVIAGGTDIFVKMQHQPAVEQELLCIRDLAELQQISQREDGTLVLGSLVTFTQMAKSPLLQESVPALVDAAASMGGPQIRNVATLGGNVCNGATSADSASTLFVLNARLHLQSAAGKREIPIEAFYLGPGQVDLQKGEILTEIHIAPEDYLNFSGYYLKYAMRKAMDIATLGVSVACKGKDGRFDEVRIGLGVAGPTPIRCREAEAYGQGKPMTEEVIAMMARRAVASTKARTSWRASQEYREHLVVELTQRAFQAALQRAGGVANG